MKRTRMGLLAVLSLALAFISCVSGGNSGSETTNGLTGVVKDVEGRPVAGARVLLLPEEYDPAAQGAGARSAGALSQGAQGAEGVSGPVGTVTDAKGGYLLEDLVPGLYHLEFSDSLHGSLGLIRDVRVFAESVSTVNGMLGMPGAVTVRISDFVGAGESGYVYIPGTMALARVDSAARAAGAATLDPAPVGRFPELILVVESSSGRRVVALAEDFEVFAESTSLIAAFQSWKYSRRIAVNTVAAGVDGAVADFPLLVRLRAEDFDFGQAQADGRDLRFTGADGEPIPFRIERWDPAAGRGEIWALLDSVAGGDAEQYVTMHWGRGLTTADAPGPEVFRASDGFATVYHLNEPGNRDAGGYKDAGTNRNHATAATVNADARVEGVAGGAKAFAGAPLATAGVLTAAMPPGFSGDFSYTVSFWIRFEMTQTRQTIMDFGGVSSSLRDVHFLIRPDTLSQFGAYDANRSSGQDPATWQNVLDLAPFVGRWLYVAVAYDASRRTISTYLDGVKAGEAPTSPLEIDPADGMRIGKALASHPSDSPFNGVLDEVRFCNRVLSADRIKLDYETQKP